MEKISCLPKKILKNEEIIMSEKKIGGAGLRGQSAGETALCTVGQSGSGLTYCGYDVSDLADNATRMAAPYDVTAPIETLWEQIEDAIEQRKDR